MTGMNGFERQLRTWRSALDAGAERVGWKIALGLVDDQEEPQLGHLTSATRIEEGGTYHRGGHLELRAEAELAVVVDAGYAAAIELVDVGRPPSDLESIVAANVFHRAFVLGATGGVEPVTVSLRVGATVHLPDQPGEDPETAIAHAARQLAAVGERLEPGDVLLTGSRIHVPVAPGELVELEMGALGRLSVRIAA
jgi:2-oxo-3-hexenedioate decarboxylase